MGTHAYAEPLNFFGTWPAYATLGAVAVNGAELAAIFLNWPPLSQLGH